MSDPTAATGLPSPVPRSKHQRKLSNYLLDKNLQLRYILLVTLLSAVISGALGYIVTFGLIAQIQADRDVWTAAAFGIIPLAVGIGYFLDWSMIRSDARSAS